MFIPDLLYKNIIESTVNLCVDVFLIKNGQYLLIKRNQDPVKNHFWPIGGRIHKGETAEDAARRKIKEEIGLDYTGSLISVGYYEDQYTANSFSSDTHYHTLSIVFHGEIADAEIKLDETSTDFGYFDSIPDRFVIKKFTL